MLASVGGKFEASAGAGGQAGFYLGYDDRGFKIRAKAGVVLGLGCAGETVFTVDAKNVAELMQFVYHSLMQADFDHLDFIQYEEFEAMDLFLSMHLWVGEQITDLADKGIGFAEDWWTDIRHQ